MQLYVDMLLSICSQTCHISFITQGNTYVLLFLQFNKAVGKIKDAISALPAATVDDDNEEAAALATATASKTDATAENKAGGNGPTAASDSPPDGSFRHAAVSEPGEGSSDPFGLDELLAHEPKRSERAREKGAAALNRKAEEEEESRRFLKSRREALLRCLEIAARRYRIPW
jgi:hypothetical protein